MTSSPRRSESVFSPSLSIRLRPSPPNSIRSQGQAGLAAEVALDLAQEAGATDRVGAVIGQVGVLFSTGVAVMNPVGSAVGKHIPQYRIGTQPLPHHLVEPIAAEQGFMAGLVHQHRQPQLPAAKHQHRQQQGQGVGPGDHQREHGGDNQPVTGHQPPAGEIAALG